MCDCAECVYRGIYTSLCNAVGLKTNFFFLQDVLGHDYSYAHFLVSSAEAIPTFTFYKADGQLCQYTGLLLSLHTCCCDGLSPFLLAGRRLPALCREPHVSWGVAYGKESTAISLSLKVFLALAVC